MTSELGDRVSSSTFAGRGVHGAWLEKTIMPSNFKKLVRARMAKTGEKWQAAERHVRSQVQGSEAGGPSDGEAGVGARVPKTDPFPPSHYDKNRLWFPLRRDGAWLDEAYWERNLQVLRSRSDGRRALSALGEIFTPAWSREQFGTEGLHPVVYDSIMIGGRHKLLEVGTMLASIQEKKRLRDRLWPKHEYQGTCAELRGGLLLRTAGAETEWEPVRDGSGPDWLARWTSGPLAAEVKCPRESKRALDRQRVMTEFFFEFMRCVGDPPLRVDCGIWLTLHPTDAVLARTVLGSIDTEAVRLIAKEAADAVRSSIPVPVRDGRLSVAVKFEGVPSAKIEGRAAS